MATSGDVTVAHDGGQGNVKIHPYLVTLVRWCVSCFWSTATVFLHRLMTTPLQPISGPKPAPGRVKVPKRAAGTEHLHPEPRVECRLLHHPASHTMDVIFVHGLYGSLGNTWRQGEWHQKYVADPKIVTLRDHSKPNACNCNKNSYKNHIHNDNKCNDSKITENSYTNHMHNENKCDDGNVTDLNDPEMSFKKINEKLSKKVIPEENDLITEQFYNNTLRDQVNTVENYDTQAKFVRDMFKKETDCDKNYENNTYKYNEENRLKRENSDNDFKCIYNENDTFKYNDENGFKCDQTDFKCDENSDNDFKCKYNEVNDFNECKCGEEKKCEVGCGCICNDCYSTCWPRDWIKMDFPGARVIAINYTSDPYLWRPLWIKENKRLNLYQRAEQMIEQLLDMGVGERPIVWVGHSKGGLFIKQIYCEAFEAYMKMNKNLTTNETKQVFSKKMEDNSPEIHNGITAENIDTIIGHFSQKDSKNNNCTRKNDNHTIQNEHYKNEVYTKGYNNFSRENDNNTKENDNHANEHDYTRENYNNTNENDNYTNKRDNCTKENDNYARENDNYTKESDYTKVSDNHAREHDYTRENYNNRNNNTNENDNYTNKRDNYTEENDNFGNENHNYKKEADNYRNIDTIANNNACVMNETVKYENVFEQRSAKDSDNDNLEYVNVITDNIRNLRTDNGDGRNGKKQNDATENEDLTSSIEGCMLTGRASLWASSRGFMFYSVPHRGSPLADIKTPVTARSVDLLEIAKDCPLVLELQSRWERAVGPVGTRSPPAVRSVVETCRTLMSVLWLRIVSTDSADAGIGMLSGISVDHREICKPTSRSCLLYTMLTDLIRDATTCTCQ